MDFESFLEIIINSQSLFLISSLKFFRNSVGGFSASHSEFGLSENLSLLVRKNVFLNLSRVLISTELIFFLKLFSKS